MFGEFLAFVGLVLGSFSLLIIAIRVASGKQLQSNDPLEAVFCAVLVAIGLRYGLDWLR